MPRRDFNDVNYVPLLTVRPAELRALQELPSRDKDRLLPYFFLRPWAAAYQLDAALDKIEIAYGDRPFIIDLAQEEPVETPRPVHDQLAALRDSANGYVNWCDFIESHRNFIPSLQLDDPAQFANQAERLLDLGRGLAVRFDRNAFPVARRYAERLAALADQGSDLCLILDYGRGTRDLLTQEVATVTLVRSLVEAAPGAMICVAASSFPDGFTGISAQEIYERRLFNAVRTAIPGARLVYADRGSARAERQLGGGGAPAPRIDYALPLRWTFYRSDGDGNRAAAYRAMAVQAMSPPDWDGALRVWGTQMIERTALGDPEAIISPMRATSARINIHLHRQLFYDDPGAGLYDTDEEWSD